MTWLTSHRSRLRKPSRRWQKFNTDLTRWLVDRLPAGFDAVLQWLDRRQLVLLIGALIWLFVPLLTIRPGILQQSIVAIVLIAAGSLFLHLEERQPETRTSEYLHLLLIVLSLLVTMRYLYYRTNYTLNFDGIINTIFSLLLYLAELYAIATLALAYFQTLRINHRKSIDFSDRPVADWFSVDIYIPTYNEDVEIVRKTALGALAIDYPASKKRVYILDDGRAEKYRDRREELRQMCLELGCTMLTRDNNDHAKAGNINTALQRTQGDLVLILDCDHIPTRSFLKETVGFFYKDSVSLVQTPHWFYNPDPFERNLQTGGQVPVGNELFYKVLQKGNDFWNAAFFCGSAAVVRRSHLLKVGGIATETVTEDCHTSLRLHSLGYETVYYDKIMVAGLAPEKFSSYVGQQVRWARGMAQILRLENPLLNRKLKLNLAQRICYFSATSHFFFGFPRLMYAIAPTLFLLFGINSVNGLGLETLAYALPHIVLSMQTNHIAYKHVRFSFWNEIYEFALSFQAGLVTMFALINPKLGSFNVTDKGLVVTKRSFDFESMRLLVILGVVAGASLLAVPFWLILSPQNTQAVLINAIWCAFNIVLVVAACLAAFEQPQLRRAHRLPREITAIVHTDNESWAGQTVNISETGALVLLDVWPNIADRVRLELIGDYGARALLDAHILRATATDKLQTLLSIDFVNVSRTQLDDLVLVLYSDVQQWYSQSRAEADNPLASIHFIATSLKRAFRELRPEIGVKVRKQMQATAELYWEGWEGDSYSGIITEMGTRDLRLELDTSIDQWEHLEQLHPIIALLISRDEAMPAQSVLAQIEAIDVLSRSTPEGRLQRMVMELSFPTHLDRQQHAKIKRLLR
ncbi:UDP-forming cellulose synthase catalytic subunit [Microcoleus sp. FACHB-1515]|uniref:UDP-forming cellulose synthase catalytic subunit n=1 Tax=Cyanophyceae TaxID=3028117 RepID=UPI0016828ED8|nr:UDP-forming cellulose synthase catalytic subunit [Microcoleus sp. FACHB-1515]MBD2091539.1 UDP-forming cellulose synthase catalytic subunit [Microcoleus sp. FACHB-1515]